VKLEKFGLPGWLLLMGALTAIGPVSIDMYLPAFPSIAEGLNATHSQVERTLAIYLIGMSLAQLVYGPLADRFGRKPPLYGALTLYILASAGCAFAPNIEVLTACRLFQAMGGAAGMVISRAVVRDHYGTQDAARALSMLMLIMGVAPILAPIIGGQILALTGWRGIFALITVAALILLLTVSRVMVESLHPDRVIPLSWANILKNYAALAGNRRFVAFAMSGAMGSATMFGYIVASPRLFIEHYGISSQSYGLLFGLNAISLIIGSQVSARLLKKYRPVQLLPWALRVMLVAGLTAFGLTLAGLESLPQLMGCMMTFMFCQGFVGPNSAAMALSDQGSRLGSASALLGTFTIASGATAGFLVSLASDTGPLPMALIMGGCTTLAWLIGGIARRK